LYAVAAVEPPLKQPKQTPETLVFKDEFPIGAFHAYVQGIRWVLRRLLGDFIPVGKWALVGDPPQFL